MTLQTKLAAAFGLLAAASLFSGAALAESCKSAALVKEGKTFTIALENQCEQDVFWAYNACLGAKSLESGKARVKPGQTFATKFDYDFMGSPTLLENNCTGNCLAALPECPNPLSTKSAEAEPESTSIYDRLSSLTSEGEQKEHTDKPDSLLVKKPTTQPTAINLGREPASKPAPALKAKPVTLPDNVGVEPVTPPEKEITLNGIPKTERYGAAPCVLTEMGQRNWFGQSKIAFHNTCPKPVVIGARFCVDGRADQQKIVTIGKDKTAYESVKHAKGVKPAFKFEFCQSEGCAPEMPTSCGE